MTITKKLTTSALAGILTLTSGLAFARVPADQFFASTDNAHLMDLSNSVADCAGFYMAVGTVMEEENYGEAGQEEATMMMASYTLVAMYLEMMAGQDGEASLDTALSQMDVYLPKVRNGEPSIIETNDYCSSINDSVQVLFDAAMAEE